MTPPLGAAGPGFDLSPAGTELGDLPETHPNDLFARETATFRLLIDGEPAASARIEVVPGGMRYRTRRTPS